MRRVRSQLRAVTAEIRGRGTGPYWRFDHNIYQLFFKAWLVADRQQQCTYNVKAHGNLMENYLSAMLHRTAEIAVTMHPEQCKYAEIAERLADDVELYLERIFLITKFDPLLSDCPQCKETLPAHKANCMAAICWQCKYPTPPRNPNSSNESTVTPQCHDAIQCKPRGEQIPPVAPVTYRLTLPFTVSQSYGDVDMRIHGLWPNNKRDLNRLLEQLQHD